MISVVIPTHNRPKDLRNALESIFNQTFLPDELILVDDGSSPAVSEMILANAPQELKVKLLRNEEPRGANNARNSGIKEASGDWIAFLDDDDEFLPHKIKTVFKTIRECKNIDLLYHPAKIYMVNENITYTTNPTKFNESDDILRSLLIRNGIGGTPMTIVRKNKLHEVGLFDEELDSLQDYELWLRFAKHDANMKSIDKPLTQCNYQTKKKSISKSISTNRKSLNFIEGKYCEQYKKLSKEELKEHEAWKWDMQIHKAYLNKQYWQSIMLNFEGYFQFGKIKYLFLGLASLLGADFIFKLRSLKT